MAVVGKNWRFLQLALGKTGLANAAVSCSSNSKRYLSESSSRSNIVSAFTSKLGDTTKKSHSRMLSDKDSIYALYTDLVRPGFMDSYLSNSEKNAQLLEGKKDQLHCSLIGSWTVSVGELDQALHLWQYTGGFQSIDKARQELSTDSEYQALLKERNEHLKSRHLKYMLAFSYWPGIEKRQGDNVYEVRSYTLKPGTMIEWGNNWARGINHRRKYDEAFAGLFSQVGRLCEVYHIWCYKDLQARKEARENAWREPGWDDCVAYTVPLIQTMHSRILRPTCFSPTR